jgi:hypothetical protein
MPSKKFRKLNYQKFLAQRFRAESVHNLAGLVAECVRISGQYDALTFESEKGATMKVYPNSVHAYTGKLNGVSVVSAGATSDFLLQVIPAKGLETVEAREVRVTPKFLRELANLLEQENDVHHIDL